MADSARLAPDAGSEAPSLLEPIHFADRPAALAVLRRLSQRCGASYDQFQPRLLAALAAAADPDRSLVYFERFAESYGPDLFPELEKNPRVIEILVTLFSASRFLTEILLRNPESLALLGHRQALTERKSIDRIAAEAEAVLQPGRSYPEQLEALRHYQHGELLRVGASNFLDLYDMRSVLSQLSRMSIGLVRACLKLASQQTGISAEGFVVLGMGKLGGYELNYSSDIDLLLIAREDPESYLPLAERLIEIIDTPTAEGFLYRVDMRLRPWGKDGPLVSSLPAYIQYVEKSARLWEKQALLKVRPIAGDLPLGEELRREIEPRIHRATPEQVRREIFAMKQRTEEFLKQKGREWGEVKLGVGSIRDIEFVVQSLQMTHPNIRTRATLKAIPRLREEGLVTPAEARVLTDGYVFLRTIEHYLQMLDYRQTYTLPSDPAAIALLARRLGFEGPHAGESFVARYQEHCEAIRTVFLRQVGQEAPAKSLAPSGPSEPPQVQEHVARMDASYADTFTPADIRHHAALAGQLDGERLAIVDAVPIEHGQWRVTVVAYDYPGELSIICGLMFVYRLNILDGNAFTYEPLEAGKRSAPDPKPARRARPGAGPRPSSEPAPDAGRKLVDVFTVKPVGPEPADLWERYSQDLGSLLKLMRLGQRREARGEMAKRVGAAFQNVAGVEAPLLPIEITIDNQLSEQYTVLRIDAPDTVGFLYELTNALAFYQIYIARVLVRSIGRRVQDILYVTDDEAHKITDPGRQRELRAAIVLIKNFTHLLPRSPNPEAALLHFREFIFQLFQRPDWPDELASLERSDVLSALARLLGVSDFLWDDFLRMQYENLFPVVRDVDALRTAKSRQEMERELSRALITPQVLETEEVHLEGGDWRTALNTFKDRQLFRIDMRHILGVTAEFWEFSAELTDLAEIVLRAALETCGHDLRAQFGEPRLEDGRPCPLALAALGKCGGRELGFASDIELMFIYGGAGHTDGPKPLTTGEYFDRLVQAVVGTIQARQEGIFQIDLQLRPYGKAGGLAVALDSFRRYFAPDGPAWAYERQALVKLRPIAGDEALGAEICKLRDEFVYSGRPFDVISMRAMRERQLRHLVTGGTFNAKFSPGGLVDVEYLVQGLQINYGGANPALRSTNIRAAMAALNEAGILGEDDYARLRKAHTFLRWLIDSLRVVRGNTKDVTIPPYDSEEFAFLARRLRYGSDTARLQEELTRYASDVQEINTRLLG
jgi:glutamate-ammonia-ligase adenylyltransferase